ncbi:MAG TPA: hypothetical protein ENG90_03750 [Gammaproteobacteria bacterium]|nr:hypothetical protein [Gammaproteobacteria bacterium]
MAITLYVPPSHTQDQAEFAPYPAIVFNLQRQPVGLLGTDLRGLTGFLGLTGLPPELLPALRQSFFI